MPDSRDQSATETVWIDRWGNPMADYEVDAIESEDWDDLDGAAAYLDFAMHPGHPAECNTCGALFGIAKRYLRAHRRLCGWDNGTPAVKARGEA
jgi:hypothetical protein